MNSFKIMKLSFETGSKLTLLRCMQDTLMSRAHGLSAVFRLWAECACDQRYLAYNLLCAAISANAISLTAISLICMYAELLGMER